MFSDVTLMINSGINEVDCIESLMNAYESKINIFEGMRYFLMFHLNLGLIVCWELVLLIQSIFSFLSIGQSFSRTFVLQIVFQILFIFQPHVQSKVLIQSTSLILPDKGPCIKGVLPCFLSSLSLSVRLTQTSFS